MLRMLVDTSINQTHEQEDPDDEPLEPAQYRRVFLATSRKFRGSNHTVNSKYNLFTFLPLVLYQQFKYFFNLYFLALTVTQFVPPLKVGFLANYIGPLSLVLTLSLLKEAYDDLLRHARDKQLNNQEYMVLTRNGVS